VDEGEVDKLVQSVLRQAVEVRPCTVVLSQLSSAKAVNVSGHEAWAPCRRTSQRCALSCHRTWTAP
jgi:hypothetical protein